MTYNEIRMEICKGCDRFNSFLKICKECGCFMPGKTLMKGARCPQDKWIEIHDERKNDTGASSCCGDLR